MTDIARGEQWSGDFVGRVVPAGPLITHGGAVSPTAPVMQVLESHTRDDSERLRELLAACRALDTNQARLLVVALEDVVKLAHHIADELGIEWRNPPVPGVCHKMVGDCGCGGDC